MGWGTGTLLRFVLQQTRISKQNVSEPSKSQPRLHEHKGDAKAIVSPYLPYELPSKSAPTLVMSQAGSMCLIRNAAPANTCQFLLGYKDKDLLENKSFQNQTGKHITRCKCWLNVASSCVCPAAKPPHVQRNKDGQTWPLAQQAYKNFSNSH